MVNFRLLDSEKAEKLALNLLEKVGLTSKKNAYSSSLFGGQWQCVAVVRYLAMSPNLMLFDESTI